MTKEIKYGGIIIQVKQTLIYVSPNIVLILKALYVMGLIGLNILNALKCITLRPGYDNVTSHFYDRHTLRGSEILDRIQELNIDFQTWGLIIIPIVVLYLLIWKIWMQNRKKYYWYVMAGLLTMAGIFYQDYLFSEIDAGPSVLHRSAQNL